LTAVPAFPAQTQGAARDRSRCEGRISHLERGYGLRRSRLKGGHGQRI